jgi:hypothetical protein
VGHLVTNRLASLGSDPVFDVARDDRHRLLDSLHLLDGPIPSLPLGGGQGFLKLTTELIELANSKDRLAPGLYRAAPTSPGIDRLAPGRLLRLIFRIDQL